MKNPIRTHRGAVLSAAVCTLLASCGGGGGGGGTPASATPVGNLEATTLQLRSSAASAHDMEVETGIVADAEITDVPVSYFLMFKEDVDNEVEEVRQFPISSAVFEKVTPGEQAYTSTLSIPETLDPPGDYYLIAQVDPENVVPETDEEDNLPESEEKIVVRVDGSKVDLYEIKLKEVELDEETVILAESAEYGTVRGVDAKGTRDFGATLSVHVTGPDEVLGMDITGTIQVPGASWPVPIEFWNEDSQTYESEVVVPVSRDIVNEIQVDVRIPMSATARNELQSSLRASGGGKSTIRFHCNNLRSMPEWKPPVTFGRNGRPIDDNTYEIIATTLPAPLPEPSEIHWGKGYRKTWKNKAFNLSLNLHAGASLDERGAIASGTAELPLTLYGTTNKLVDFDAYSRVKPKEGEPTESQFNLDLKVLGQTVFSRSATDPNYTWSREWSISRTARGRGKVWVGPVPVDVTAGATAAIGFRSSIFIDPALMEASTGPFAEATAFAEASINAIVVKGGVRGSMTLIKDEFLATARADLSQPTPTTLQGTVSFDITNELTGPKGRIWLFVDRKVPKWCYKVVPCGFRTVTNTKTLVRFSTFRRNDVLFKKSESALVELD